MEAALPETEESRLAALRRYNILDTPSEKDFDDLVKLAARICKAPMSLVSLVDKDRQWFKGRHGVDVSETPRRLSFCAHTILHPEKTMVVTDATRDERFADNDLVRGGLHLRAYAGAPLVTGEGHALGTLCVLDTKPREWTTEEKEALQVLSRQVMVQLELRRSLAELRRAAGELTVSHEAQQKRLEATVHARTAELGKANEELRRTEDRFRALARASFEGILFTEDGRIVDCNEQLGGIVGYPADELLGRSILDFLPAEEHEVAMAAIHQNRESALELHVRHKDGGWRVVEVRGRPIEGGPLRVATLRDVTSRREAEKTVRESEERLSIVIDAARLGTWDRNLKTGEMFWSTRCKELFGLAAEAPLSYETFLERVHPEDRDRVVTAAREAIEEGVSYNVEVRVVWPDGTVRWMASRGLAYYDDQGKPTRMSGAAMDVTERKLAEEQAGLWKRVFEAADFGLAYTNAATNVFVSVNPSYAAQRGYTPEELAGKPVVMVYPSELREPTLNILAEVDRRGHMVFESEHQRKDGSRFPVLMDVTVIRDAEGRPSSRVSYAVDITEFVKARELLARSREELEEQVRERTAQLVEANTNLQSFAHTAAHDLRSPLRAISSFTQIVLDQYGDRLGEEGRAMLDRVAHSSEHMGRLLSDLLEYSKITQAELRLERVSLEQAAGEALQLLDVADETAVLSIDHPLPDVIGHPATVALVISNFLSNALKFVPDGRRPRVRLVAEPRQGAVRVVVEDNGIGISAEDAKRLFAVFERLHGKNAYPGTGLGLAIVKKATERMGGRVGVESQPGKGSRFWFELPAAS